jgi:hypothetical protein
VDSFVDSAAMANTLDFSEFENFSDQFVHREPLSMLRTASRPPPPFNVDESFG